MAAELLIQLAAAFFGTLCFALLFHVPHRHLWCCGIAALRATANTLVSTASGITATRLAATGLCCACIMLQ